jgi:hypothetical protein
MWLNEKHSCGRNNSTIPLTPKEGQALAQSPQG